MFRILVANSKGGCGKTTIATQLAGALAVSGHRSHLADADRQRSSLAWLASRPPGVAPVMPLDWTEEIGDPPKGKGFLVIDGAAGLRGQRSVELANLADLLVLPVLPSAFDEAATRRFLDRIEKLRRIASGRLPIAIVGNRIRAGTRAAASFEQFVAGLGRPIVARLRDSQLYADFAATGVSLFEARGSRVRTFQDDWYPLLAFIERQIS